MSTNGRWASSSRTDPEAVPLGVHLIVGVIYPCWYLLTPEGALDAWWTWSGVALVFVASAGLATRAPFLKSALRNMFPGPWLSTFQMYVLAWLNNMHVFYTVGSVMAVLAVTAMIPSTLGLLAYGWFVTALGAALFVLDPEPVKVACWAGVLPVILIAIERVRRTQEQAELTEEYRERLEREVAERTRELSETARRLRGEMDERARLEEELQLANKLEAVGRLAGGMAHEFNNLLTCIRLYTELALTNVPLESTARIDIAEIQKAGRQAAELTRQLLAFSRKSESITEVVDLNQLLESSRSMLRHLLGEERELDIRRSEHPLAVIADRGQLEQVLVNLTLNARDATPLGGRLTIETWALPRNVDREREFVVLSASDTGIGMDAETRARAFDPFFSRKPAGSGTGLGLSIVHGIVSQAGGHINVSSEPGKGARFDLYWPRTHETPSEVSAPDPTCSLGGGNEHILLVEDERDVRLALERLLRSGGYRVESGENADAALRIATRASAPIDLLLSDVVMPGISGIDLAESIRRVHPEAKVLLMSGHLDPRTGTQPALPRDIAFLAKPFDAADLIAKIRDVLEARAV